MTAIIFGANGQDGHYVSFLCQSRGLKVINVSRTRGDLLADVSNLESVGSIVKESQPALIFHLAANSTTSHASTFENHATICTGSLNILEAVHRYSWQSKVFITGSGVQFVNTGAPIKEDHAFAANSPYAVSRIQSVYAARYYRSLGVKAYVGYLFHHESPLRKPNHVSQKIIRAARQVAAGDEAILELGDLSVRKEWTFAGDVARGMLHLLGQEAVFEAAIGSGVAYSIQDWLELCYNLVSRNWRNHVKIKADFSAEYHCLVSDPMTMNSLGWSPQTSMEQLARMMMETPVV